MTEKQIRTTGADVLIEQANGVDTEMVKHVLGKGTLCLVSNMRAPEIISVGLEENNYEHELANYN
jgi:hypothetical protein